MEWYTYAAIIFGALFFLLATGLPIVFCFGVIALAAMYFLLGPNTISSMGRIAFVLGTNFTLIAVPLFILMGEVIIFSGLGDAGFEVVNKWLGRFPGGLALSAVGACAVFAAIIGSSVANTAIVGSVAVPEMMKRGYDKKLATGCVVAGGSLGILIPPSLLMVVYAIITEQSVGRLFIGGVFPGILLAGLFMAHIAIRCTLNPTLAPKIESVTWRDRIVSLYKLAPLVLLVVGVLGTIYFGIATPTEAAGIGAFGAIIIALAYRKLNLPKLMNALITSARTTCFVFFIMFAAGMLVFALSSLEIPQELVKWVTSLGLSRWWVIVSINVLYLVLGCVLDPAGIMILTLPVIFPIVVALGFDPIWFGIIVTVNMEAANITPPVGFNLFVMKGIAPPDVTLNDITVGSLPFVLYQILVIIILSVFPQIVLWLPSTMIRMS